MNDHGMKHEPEMRVKTKREREKKRGGGNTDNNIN
jgi:hypothetical protein